jgi:hypothetical protein
MLSTVVILIALVLLVGWDVLVDAPSPKAEAVPAAKPVLREAAWPVRPIRFVSFPHSAA